MASKRSMQAAGVDRERAIGSRLKEVRTFLGFSQAEFARQIGITKVRLATYESGRVPCRWEIALQICRQFFVSEHWLATGGGKAMGLPGQRLRFGNSIVRQTMIDPESSVLKTLPAGLAFSAAYDLALLREYWQSAGRWARTFVALDFSESDSPERTKRQMEWAIALWTSILPQKLWPKFCSIMMKSGAIAFDSVNLQVEAVRPSASAADELNAWLDAKIKEEQLIREQPSSDKTRQN